MSDTTATVATSSESTYEATKKTAEVWAVRIASVVIPFILGWLVVYLAYAQQNCSRSKTLIAVCIVTVLYIVQRVLNRDQDAIAAGDYWGLLGGAFEKVKATATDAVKVAQEKVKAVLKLE